MKTITEKRCPFCETIKPVSEFYKSKRTKSGFKSECKACMAAYYKTHNQLKSVKEKKRISASKYYYAHPDRIRAYNQTEERKEIVRKYRRSEKGKALSRKTMAKHRLQYSARLAVCRAVMGGKLPPVNSCLCSSCGAQAAHYHHPNGFDKSHQLDVIPLCVSCHLAAHNSDKIKAIKERFERIKNK